MKNENKDVWLYSWDDERFGSDEYESKEEAIEAAKEEIRKFGEFKKWVYVGKKEDATVPNIDADKVLEGLQDSINDEFGESGGYWLESICIEEKNILENRLNKVFKEWTSEFGREANWYMVVDMEEIEI